MSLNVGDLVGGVSLDCNQFVYVVSLDEGEFERRRFGRWSEFRL